MDPVCSININQGIKLVQSENTRTKAANLLTYNSKGLLWYFMNTWRAWVVNSSNYLHKDQKWQLWKLRDHMCNFYKLMTKGHSCNFWNLWIPFDHMSFTLITKLPRLRLYWNFSKSRARFVIFSWFFVFFLNIRSCTFTNTKTHILWHYWLVFGLFGPILA